MRYVLVASVFAFIAWIAFSGYRLEHSPCSTTDSIRVTSQACQEWITGVKTR